MTIEAVVPPSLEGARADKAVAVLASVSRAVARRWCEAGDVTRDGEPLRPAESVRSGDRLAHPDRPVAVELEPDSTVEFGVLYEDDDVAVVDKPAGLVVHPGAGRSSATLAAGILARWPSIEGVGQPGRWGLVHRLDRETSGALAVALRQSAHDALTAALRARTISRIYLAGVQGVPSSETGTIDAPILRDPQRPTRRTVDPSGRPSRTHFRVLGEIEGGTLLEVELETGRTHQIRVHLSRIGHPVLGDRLYGWRGAGWRDRIWLHAHRLGLTLPGDGSWIEIESPLPDELARSSAGT